MVIEPYGVYHCLFYAIEKTYMYWTDAVKDQPFVFCKFMEQIFFREDRLKHGWLSYKATLDCLGILGRYPWFVMMVGMWWDHLVGMSKKCNMLENKHSKL